MVHLQLFLKMDQAVDTAVNFVTTSTIDLPS